MKKIVSGLIVFIMCLTLMPLNVVRADVTKPDLEIVNAVFPTYELEKDDVLQFGMSIKNNSEYILRDVEISVVNDSFYAINESPIREIEEIKKNQTIDISPFTLKYNGGKEDRIFVKLSYKEGSSTIVREKVVYYKTNAKPGEDGDGIPNKPELYKPQVILMNGAQPVITGEEEQQISFKIKNDSRFDAINIELTGVFKDSNFELVEISPVKHISEMKKDDEYTVNYTLKGKSTVESGVYPVTINYSYENVYGNVWDGSYIIYIKYIQDEINTEVDLVASEEYQKINSGDEFDLELTIKNEGTDEITDVSLELIDLNSENIINKYNNYKRIDKIEGSEEEKITFKMLTNENTKTGNYPIKAKVKFRDKNGKQKEVVKTFFKKVDYIGSEILIGGISSSSQVLNGDEEFSVTVPVYNYGGKAAENVRVIVEGDAGLINITSNVVIIENLPENGVENLSFTFKTSPKVTEGTKNIRVKVYTEAEEKSVVYSIYTEAETTSNESVPKIIISKYTPEPMIVKAGQQFKLNLSFLNTHRDKTVRNIKINLTTHEGSEKTGSVFSPVNSSNTFFIDEIDPKNEAEMMITMFTIPDAQSKTYTIDVKMEYEDENGTQYSATDLIGLPVRQQSKFMTSDINVPEQVGMGEPIRLDIDISNTGKIDLANFTVKIEGDFRASNSTTYVGNIQPGSREYYDVDLFATKQGENKGTFIFSYEEPSGDIVEVRKEISTNAIEVQVPEFNNNGGEYTPDMNNKPLGEKKGFPWVKLAIGGVVLLIVIVIIVRGAKKRKRKKEMELDE